VSGLGVGVVDVLQMAASCYFYIYKIYAVGLLHIYTVRVGNVQVEVSRIFLKKKKPRETERSIIRYFSASSTHLCFNV
jgi:hypothetical protein